MFAQLTCVVRLPKKPMSAKQSVILTGLSSEPFENCARAILEVHAKLSSALPPQALREWSPVVHEGDICLEFGNRYFASGSDGAHLDTVSLGSDIDPFGLLAGAVPDGKHTEDNKVLYYEKMTSEKK